MIYIDTDVYIYIYRMQDDIIQNQSATLNLVSDTCRRCCDIFIITSHMKNKWCDGVQKMSRDNMSALCSVQAPDNRT